MRALLLILFVAFSAPLQAGKKFSQEYCYSMTDLVAIAMTARQKGMLKEDVHLVIKDESKELRDIFEVMVDNAYKFPVMESGAEAEMFVAEYANNYFVDCINLPKDR